MKRALNTIKALRSTIVPALLGCFIFSVPAQILELYTIEIEVVSHYFYGNPLAPFPAIAAWIINLVTVCALGFALFCCLALCSLSLIAAAHEGESAVGPPTAVLILVGLIALAPGAGAIMGIIDIRKNAHLLQSVEVDSVKHHLLIGALSILASLIVMLAILIYVYSRNAALVAALQRHLFLKRSAFTVVALFAVVTVLFSLFPGVTSQPLGTIGTILLFLIFLTYFLSAGSISYFSTGWPIIPIVLGVVIALWWTGTNDNHKVAHTLREIDAPYFDLENKFVEWMNLRGDKEYYQTLDLPYPVYIVAAEGGGLYAAFNVASFMAKLQDECPNFSQHVFAMSAVSGGSLGSAVFNVAAQALAANTTWRGCDGTTKIFQNLTTEYFRYDFLTPVIAGLLFSDTLQRVLPVPVEAFDRGKALDNAFADAWRRVAKSLPDQQVDPKAFTRPVSSSWHVGSSAPLLMLNTTSVETGTRVTISPLLTTSNSGRHLSEAFCVPKGNKHYDVDLTIRCGYGTECSLPVGHASWLAR